MLFIISPVSLKNLFIEKYGEVALSGKSTYFETFAKW